MKIPKPIWCILSVPRNKVLAYAYSRAEARGWRKCSLWGITRLVKYIPTNMPYYPSLWRT